MPVLEIDRTKCTKCRSCIPECVALRFGWEGISLEGRTNMERFMGFGWKNHFTFKQFLKRALFFHIFF